MANRYLQQFFFSFNHQPVWIEASCSIGAAGAVSAVKGDGVANIILLATGVYQVKLQDSYYRYLGSCVQTSGPVTGSAVAGGAFVPTTLYQIQTLGTTTQAQWEAAGLPAGVPAAIGLPFVATAVGAGSGTVKALTTSGVAYAEVAANPQLTVTQKNYPYFVISCFDSAGAPVAPASGSVLRFDVTLRNSSVKEKANNMIIHDPKKAAGMIISSALPDREDSSGDSGSDDSIGIAQDILEAVKSGSVHALADALKAFHASCESYDGDAGEMDSEE